MQNYIYDIIKKLSEAQVEFVICGGVACFIQGVDRTTFDIDINLSIEDANLSKVIKVFKENNFIPRIPEPMENLLSEERRNIWINEKGAVVYTLNDKKSIFQIDIFLKYPIPFCELKENADVFEIDNYKFLVSSKKDLILAKKSVIPLRDKDIYDIKQLERLINDGNK